MQIESPGIVAGLVFRRKMVGRNPSLKFILAAENRGQIVDTGKEQHVARFFRMKKGRVVGREDLPMRVKSRFITAGFYRRSSVTIHHGRAGTLLSLAALQRDRGEDAT